MDKLSSNVKTQSRRRFVKKAAVGASLVALPVRSVWANGITNSIVASGHGSDWANGASINLQTPKYWFKNLLESELTADFFTVFGGNPVNRNGSQLGASKTFAEILSPYSSLIQPGVGYADLSDEQKDLLGGRSRYNARLIAMYFNAEFGKDTNNMHNVVYPVANGRPFESSGAFAKHLYKITISNPSAAGEELRKLIKHDENYSIL